MNKTYLFTLIVTTFLIFGCNKKKLTVYDNNYELSLVVSDTTLVLHHHYKGIFKTLDYGELPPLDDEKRRKFTRKNWLDSGHEILYVRKWIYSFSDSIKLKARLSNIYNFYSVYFCFFERIF